MRHIIETLSIALSAVFVFGVVVTSASASQPKFEYESGQFPVSFAGSGGAGKLETVAEGTKVRKVNCNSNTSTGELSSATTVSNIVVKFKECTTTGPIGEKMSCGEIVTTKLKGKLYYLTAGSSEVGVDLEPESGTEFAKFVCKNIFVTETLTVTGSVVGKLTPVNTLANKFTLTFSQKAGHQEPEGYLAAVGCAFTKDVLSTTGSGSDVFGPIQSGVEGVETITTAENVKVVATKCE
jgi:hypothetical protein